MAPAGMEAQMAASVRTKKTLDRQGLTRSELVGTLRDLAGPGTSIPELRTFRMSSGAVVTMPGSYHERNPLAIRNPREDDTSDRTLVRRVGAPPAPPSSAVAHEPPQMTCLPARSKAADAIRFDSSGFNTGIGLQKDLFYWSPFLTCSKCNNMAIIDSMNARSFSGLMQTSLAKTARAEPLPKCSVCGSTQDWWVGSHDLTKFIGASREELEALLRRQKKAVVVIQRSYRFYLRRQWGRAERQRKKIRAMLEYRAASIIEALIRGRLGRRKAKTTVSIRIIMRAHSKLVSRAVSDRSYKRRVFWYKPDQLKILYLDYVVLCERTGFQPPRVVVEENLKEIARRIRIREAFLTTLVQKRWRGITVRRFMVVYMREVFRIRELQCAAAFKIQRLVHGFRGRRYVEAHKINVFKAKMSKEYMHSKHVQLESQDKAAQKVKLANHYAKERQEERTARLVGLVHPGAADGHKMKAFNQSAYGTDSVTDLMLELRDMENDTVTRETQETNDVSERGEFVRQRQLEGRALKLYYKEEMRQRSVELIDKLTKERPQSNAAKLLAAHNRKGIKFNYPKAIYVDPMEALYEGTGIKTREQKSRRARQKQIPEDQDSVSTATSASSRSTSSSFKLEQASSFVARPRR
uniref:Uncharacterized protein n=1 Tax=Rhizochromulina marina TaxID=1034831 RepID=A0A7S2R5D9_9STRA|mmetsp:Transcript_11219/g.32242  ORF Transcript_11219/g.32242 Transcript_11219/m.32242 type:complete len:636 (+) Transcript_11219:86-1993(+)